MRVMQWRRVRVAKLMGAVWLGTLVLIILIRRLGMDRDTGNTSSNANLSARGSPKTPQILYPDDSEVFTQTCGDSMSSLDIMDHVDRRNSVIYFITPTYGRREQVAELTRLSQTLLHINNLVWIIAEDSRNCTSVVSGALFRLKNRIPHVHLASPMPVRYINEKPKPRGVASRNAGVQWVLNNEPTLSPGVIYFGDDDNTYDLSLLEEIRQTGFAVNIELLKKYRPKMPYLAGFEETLFLENMNVTFEDIEPRANYCTEILVWHTQTKNVALPIYQAGSRRGQSLVTLMDDMSSKGMSRLMDSSSGGKPIRICMKRDGCDHRVPIRGRKGDE